MRRRLSSLVLMACCGLLSCSNAPATVLAGVPVPGDAVAELAFPGLDGFVDLVATLAAAGLIPVDHRRLSRSGLEAAGIAPPLAVVERPTGGTWLVAGLADVTRLQGALSLVLPDLGLRSRRLLGLVDALVDDAGDTRALVRGGNGVVIVVVGPTDALAEASLVEALATGALAGPRRDPKVIAWRLQPHGLAASMVGVVEGELRQQGGALSLEARVPLVGASPLTAGAFGGGQAPSACMVEDGAVVVAHLPALAALVDAAGVDDVVGDSADAFVGRLTVGLFATPDSVVADQNDLTTLGSLVVVGRPRPAGREGLGRSLTDAVAGLPVTTKTVGTHEVQHVSVPGRPWRDIDAVVADDVFALGVGAPIVIDRIAAGVPCQPSSRLLAVDGQGLLRLIERAKPEVQLVRRVASLTGADDPLSMVSALQRLTIDGEPAGDGSAINLHVLITLVANRSVH